jgi:hypothetical protein
MPDDAPVTMATRPASCADIAITSDAARLIRTGARQEAASLLPGADLGASDYGHG